jgi:hypothetical protein
MSKDHVLDRLMNEAIIPHAVRLAEIISAGRIPVVVFEPSDEWQSALRLHGYNGERVFAMPLRMRRALFRWDDVVAAWLDRHLSMDPPPASVLVVMRDEALLLNCGRDGWTIEWRRRALTGVDARIGSLSQL